MKVAISENTFYPTSIPNCPNNFRKEQVAKLVYGVVFAALIGLACMLGLLVAGISSATAVAVGGSAMITGVVLLALWFGLKRVVIEDLEGTSSLQIESSKEGAESPFAGMSPSSAESSYHTVSEEAEMFSGSSSSSASFSTADEHEEPSKKESLLPTPVSPCNRRNRYYYEMDSEGVIRPVCVPVYMGELAFRDWLDHLRRNGYCVV